MINIDKERENFEYWLKDGDDQVNLQQDSATNEYTEICIQFLWEGYLVRAREAAIQWNNLRERVKKCSQTNTPA